MNRRTIFFLLIVLFLWRIGIQGVSLVGKSLMKFEPTYPYSKELYATAPAWIAQWAGFDGVHYLTIIRQGYVGTGLIQAFFPLYPLFSRVLFFLQPVYAGLVISFVFFFLSCIVGYYYCFERKYSRKQMLLALALFLIFPTSFYFVSVYTESIFLFFTFCTFLAVMKKQWVYAAVFAGLASATRVNGIFLSMFFFLEYLRSRSRDELFHLRTMLYGFISVSGLLAYMGYLWFEFHDPLYFFHVQEEFTGARQESLVLFPQVLFRAIKILLTVPLKSWTYYVASQEFFLTILFLAIGIWFFLRWRWKNISYQLFFWGSFLLPTLTGTLQSMPRYLLSLLPIILVGIPLFEKKNLTVAIVFVISILLLFVNIVLFTHGRWVS